MPRDLAAAYQQIARAAVDPDPRAAITVAAHAVDADDARLLLDALGLDARAVAGGSLLCKITRADAPAA
jgi:hypothetical protein